MQYLGFLKFVQEVLEADHDDKYYVRFILDNRAEIATRDFNVFADRNLISASEIDKPNNIFFLDPLTIHHVKLEGPSSTVGFDFKKQFEESLSSDANSS